MRARGVLILGLSIATLLPGCSSDDDEVRPSPIPPGYAMLLRQRQQNPQPAPTGDPRGDTVDEMLAVVDGEVLTRRQVLRRLPLPQPGRSQPDIEVLIRAARREWAQQQLLVAAARRAGLQIPESSVDKIVRTELKRQMKANEELTEEVLTEDEYLAKRRLTWLEFREQIFGAVVAEYYLRKLSWGIGPTRPEIDMGVSPAEVRRIYHDHQRDFDVKRGVKIALFQLPFERYESDEVDLFEAEIIAEKEANKMRDAFKRGEDPEELARQFGLEKGHWQVPKDFIESFRHPRGQEFLFKERAGVRNAEVLKDDAAGPIILGVMEVRPPRRRDLGEVYYEIVRFLEAAKRARLQAQLTIDLLDRGEGVVWPPDLTDALLDEAHEQLDDIAANKVLSKARLR